MPSSREPAPLNPVGRATVLGAFLEGWRRTLHAPLVVAAMLVVTMLASAPLALVLQRDLSADLGSSLEADRAATSWDEDWASGFAARHPGLGETFTHEILGFGGTLALLDRFLENERLDPLVLTVVVAYAFLWIFLSGGILDRFARARPVRTSAFFAASGVHVWRFLRLALIVGPIYWVLFRLLQPWLLETVYDRWTSNSEAEALVLTKRVALYAIFLVPVLATSLVADMAKVRIVVEDRLSAIGALSSAVRFVRRRLRRMAALYGLNLIAAIVLARLWLQVAPAATAPNWQAVALGELYVLGRLWAKLAFMASEVAFFQGELAHRPYTALPEPIWPDSPGVEALENLRRS
jgi:hypothetical protein